MLRRPLEIVRDVNGEAVEPLSDSAVVEGSVCCLSVVECTKYRDELSLRRLQRSWMMLRRSVVNKGIVTR